jgi:hypothetical protein
MQLIADGRNKNRRYSVLIQARAQTLYERKVSRPKSSVYFQPIMVPV